MKVERAIRSLLFNAGEEKIAIIWVFACHGGMQNGLQTVIVNQYCRKTRYYKLWHVENLIRQLARKYPSSFHVGIFACCREVLENKTDCYEGPYDKAQAKYIEDTKAIETAQLQAKTNEEALKQVNFYKEEALRLKAIIEAKDESKSEDEAHQDDTEAEETKMDNSEQKSATQGIAADDSAKQTTTNEDSAK